MQTEKEKSASNLRIFRVIHDKVKSFLNSGEARNEDAGFLLDLLESGCSREEIETAMGLTLNDPKTVVRFIKKDRSALFSQTESRFGFGFALHLCLQLRLRKSYETNAIFRTFSYPAVLILSGYSVAVLYLFMIAPTIEANRSLFQTNSIISNQVLQCLFIIFSLFLLIFLIILFYRFVTRPFSIYTKLSGLFPSNPWSISLSRKLAFHLSKMHALGLSTREIYQAISSFPKEPILAKIASQILDELGFGVTPKTSLKILDPFLIRILSIDTHPDFASRLADYDRIAQKRYDYAIKKLGYFVSVFAYIFISILIFTLYKEIMAPLDMLKNMG